MSSKRVITNIDQLTTERLTEILRKKGVLREVKVAKIIEKSSKRTTTSMVHFLDVILTKNGQTEPTSLEIVVKITQLLGSAKMLGYLETKFYSTIAEAMDDMPIPLCYDAKISRITGWSHKILEDLSQTHESISLPLNVYLPPPKRHCEKVIDSLAELHAFWWDHPKLKEFSSYSHVFYIFKENSFNEKDLFKWFENQEILLKKLLNLLGDRLSDKTKDILLKISSKFPQLANERLKKGNLTIIHGDAHFAQFFYPKDIDNEKHKVILSDWQFWSVGVGGQDLSYMIGMFLFPENRNMIEKSLIKRYYNGLVQCGVKNYSWDECWDDYRLFNLLNIYRVLWWWSISSTTLDNPFWWGVLNTAILTIKDLNCMELLEGI
ncbi:MAG: oxidoreductase family protein [Promethearchaeota archaeon]